TAKCLTKRTSKCAARPCAPVCSRPQGGHKKKPRNEHESDANLFARQMADIGAAKRLMPLFFASA
ncbi:MAG: hypothetical protein ACTTKK_01780, partial [Ottowia sp.]